MALKVSRILHAGYIFESGGVQVAFDPIFENPFSRNCHAFPDVRFDYDQIRNLNLAAVFISHYHDDHCSLESLNYLDRRTPIYLYCQFEELFSMIKALGFTNVHSLQIDRPVKVGDFEIIPRRALDSDVDSMFHVKVNDLNILNVVDSWIAPETMYELKKYAPWDMVLWPFQTMREIEVLSPHAASAPSPILPTEWTEQLRILCPRIVVPSSCQFIFEEWSWYNYAFFPISYEQFSDELKALLPHTEVVRLNPSVTVLLEKASFQPGDCLGWVIPIGKQNVDYEYKNDLKIPSTSEISRNFEPLTEQQKERVMTFCHQELIDKYNSMDPPMDPYFRKPRFWRLSLYDHHGIAEHFYFHINGGRMDRGESGDSPLSWTTEVSASKLYAALELGESLTSMYIRVNDIDFEAEINDEIMAADILEDPLIRCLYTGNFGSYQRAQLRKIAFSTMER